MIVVLLAAIGVLIYLLTRGPADQRSETRRSVFDAGDGQRSEARHSVLGDDERAEARRSVFDAGEFAHPITLVLPEDLSPSSEAEYRQGLVEFRRRQAANIFPALEPLLPAYGSLRTLDNLSLFASTKDLAPLLLKLGAIDTLVLGSDYRGQPITYFKYTSALAPLLVTDSGRGGRTLKLARRKLDSETYQKCYDANPAGMGERRVCAFTFTYRVVSDLHGLAFSIGPREGQAVAMHDPATGRWQGEVKLQDPPIVPDILAAARQAAVSQAPSTPEARVPPTDPMVANTKEKAIVASMKSDLRNLVTAQEYFFSQNSDFAGDITSSSQSNGQNGTGKVLFVPSLGNALKLTYVKAKPPNPSGWNATATNPLTGDVTCGIFVGPLSHSPNPGVVTQEGRPACWSGVSPQPPEPVTNGGCYDGLWRENEVNQFAWNIHREGDRLRIARTDGFVSGDFTRRGTQWFGVLRWQTGDVWQGVVLYEPSGDCQEIRTNQRWWFRR